MQIAFSKMKGTSLIGSDDSVGSIADLFVDTQDWGGRFVVVDTGHWLPGRRVLLPPTLITERDWGAGKAVVGLTQQQVKDSPDVETNQPISRQLETELLKHYDVPYHWSPVGIPLTGGNSVAVPLSTSAAVEEQHHVESGSLNLRSVDELQDYYIKASDGEIGHVEEFVIDDQSWTVRYMVVDTKNWLPARKVLISPEWIDSISWANKTVNVKMTREQIKKSPEFDPLTPINRGYEEHLYDYYGVERYWL